MPGRPASGEPGGIASTQETLLISLIRRTAVVGVLAAGLFLVDAPPASPTGPGVQARLVDGRLEIIGSPGPDAISVGLGPSGGDALEIFTGATRGPDFAFRRAEVTQGIRVTLGDGDDTFAVSETNGVFSNTVPVSVAGENGDDHLAGGSGGETLDGGPGCDVVEGRGGLDQITLGAADDTAV